MRRGPSCTSSRQHHNGFRSSLALQKPCIAGSRSLRNNQFKAKPLRSSAQRSDLLLAIPGFVVFGALVHILLSVFDESVKQAGELARHGGDGFGSTQTGTQTTVLCSQVAWAFEPGSWPH